MRTNDAADLVLSMLKTKHDRVFRNKAPAKKEFPYIVFRFGEPVDSYPSEDCYLNIDIYEDSNVSVRNVEGLADIIDNMLNHRVVKSNNMNLQFEREQRQSTDAKELIGAYLINIRYVVRAYFY